MKQKFGNDRYYVSATIEGVEVDFSHEGDIIRWPEYDEPTDFSYTLPVALAIIDALQTDKGVSLIRLWEARAGDD